MIAVAAIPAAVVALLAVPVKLPSTFANNVPVDIVKFPVLAPVKLPVPTINLSALSSKPINALSEEPLSITIPASLLGEPEVPFANSIIESVTVVLVVSIVVVVPFTSKLPVIVTLPVAAISANVTLEDVATACPILNSPEPDNVTPVPPDKYD